MTGEYSLSDISAVTGGNRNNDMFGGDGAWWIILFLIFAAFGGWGNGFGGNGQQGGVYENYTLVSDFASLERKIDGVYAGICDSTFALNNTITNGFASAQQTMTQGFAGLNTAIVQQGYENRLGQQNIGQQISSCCCDLRQQVADVNYNLASQACGINRGIESGFAQTNYNMATNTNSIIQSTHSDTDRVIAKLDAMEMARKDEKIADLQAMNFDLRLAASQERQNNYLVSRLDPNPCPVSAYVVQPPQAVTFPTSCCGVASYNSGCGCNGIA